VGLPGPERMLTMRIDGRRCHVVAARDIGDVGPGQVTDPEDGRIVHTANAHPVAAAGPDGTVHVAWQIVESTTSSRMSSRRRTTPGRRGRRRPPSSRRPINSSRRRSRCLRTARSACRTTTSATTSPATRRSRRTCGWRVRPRGRRRMPGGRSTCASRRTSRTSLTSVPRWDRRRAGRLRRRVRADDGPRHHGCVLHRSAPLNVARTIASTSSSASTVVRPSS
jgi:hypothetical protein